MGKALKIYRNKEVAKRKRNALKELAHFEPEIMAMENDKEYIVGGIKMKGVHAKEYHNALKAKYS